MSSKISKLESELPLKYLVYYIALLLFSLWSLLMKKSVLIFIVCLCNSLFAEPIQDRKINSSALLQLTTTLGIAQDADIVAATQKQWLRKGNLERWEMSELSPMQKNFVLKWANEQGLLDAWTPLNKAYDTAVLLGGATFRMEKRLSYLIELWNQGIHFDRIVWLTGDRPLDPKVESLASCCTTESEAARLLWEKANLPEQMRHVPITFVSAPMKTEGLITKRPGTRDIIKAWVDTAPESCSALFVSNQPFCGYQFAVIKSTLPKSIQFDLVGPSIDSKSLQAPAAVILDTVARWIYSDRD